MVIKQHWIPRMHIKEWVNEEDNLTYFSLEQKEFKSSKYNRNKRKFTNDPFFIEEFYEHKDYFFNEIEDNLAWIENEFSAVKSKIIKSQYNNKLTLDRKDLSILKTYINTMSLRTKSILKRYDELDGDPLFKSRFENTTKEERRTYLLNMLNNFIELQKEELTSEYSKPNKRHQEIFNTLKDDLISFSHLSQYNSVKIFRSKEPSFLLSDQFGAGIINAFPPGGFLISLYPITPNLCIGLLPENELIRMARRKGGDILHEGAKATMAKIGFNYDKFLKFDAKVTYISNGNRTWKDKFKYEINNVSYEESIIMNAFITLQSSDIIAFKKTKYLEDTFEAEKKYDMYRSESEYQN